MDVKQAENLDHSEADLMTALPSLSNIDLRKPHLHPVRHADLKQLYKRERHHLFFQMQTLADDLGESNSRKDHLGITTVELGKCLPWIPSDSTIVLYCSGGFSPMLRLQLSSLHTDRSLFLVDDDAPPLKSF